MWQVPPSRADAELTDLLARVETALRGGLAYARLTDHLISGLNRALTTVAEDSFSIESPSEVVALLRTMLTADDLTSIDSVINTDRPGGGLWGTPRLQDEWVTSCLLAAQRGRSVRHVLIMDDWLRFASDIGRFAQAKRCAAAGIEVQLAQRANVPRPTVADQVLLTYASFRCGLRIEPHPSGNDAILMHAVLSEPRIKELHDSVATAWELPQAFRLRPI